MVLSYHQRTKRKMNIRETLIRDSSKATCEEIVDYIGDDAQRANEWAVCFFKPDYDLNQRAAWVFHFLTDFNPYIIDCYQKEFLAKLKEPNLHDAVIRAICRHWGNHGFPDEIEGEVYDTCLNYLRKKSAIAIKAYAMFACFRLITKYPELAIELKLVLEEMLMKYGEDSAALRSRGNKLLKKLTPYL
jgi:hypothetical protein